MTEKKMTGYPSVDKPWLKYYTQEQINAPLPHMSAYEYLKKQNADRMDYLAIDSEVGCYTYGELFNQIDATAASLWSMGLCKGKNVLAMFPALPHESFLFYGVDAVGSALCQIAPLYTATEVCTYVNRIDAKLFFVFDYILTSEMEQMLYANTQLQHIVVVNFTPLQGRDKRTISWEDFIEIGKGSKLPEIHRDNANDVLFFASTGGTTGTPKSVMLSDDSFNLAVHQYISSPLPYEPGHKCLRMFSIYSGAIS
ncbi:MAG: acyl--CoA ligase, partial [Oscillospiraceae bacterium]|nr:acyl--CoA ligase [Oscillospiraceae bacterium]